MIFFLIVPLIAFITWIIRRVARVRSKKSYLGWIFGGLWTIGWIMLTLFIASITRDFREYEHVDNALTINQPSTGKMIVAVSQPELEYSGNFGWIDNNEKGWDLSSDSLKIAAVKFNVKASTDDLYRVTLKRYSFGKTEQDALNRAEKIRFQAVSRDSVLDLANSYAIDQDSKFRGQYVEVEIQVPIGKKLRFDESINEKLNSLNIKVRRGYRRNRINGITIETDNESFRFRSGVDYVMGVDGELKSATGNVVTDPAPNEYRYRESDSLELEKSIEEKKRELQRLEEKKSEIKQDKSVTQKKNVQLIKDGALAGGPSPVSTMTQWF
jgi:hypothetical protein